jgi:aminoglycoside phosphotransferase (APT) family kinase protein
MHFIKDNTSVPIPRVFRVHKYKGTTFIETEFIPGREAYVWHQKQALMEELESYVKQIRSLDPPTPEIVTSAYGNYCRDPQFGLRLFSTHSDLHSFLRIGLDLSDWDTEYAKQVIEYHTRNYVSKFTHGDLAPRNVLVHNGRISAIIDWDCAGWRPEYSELPNPTLHPWGS